MTRIGSVDHVLLLLRNQLETAGRTRTKATSASTAARADAGTPLDRVRAIATLKSLSEEERRRIVVRGLLTAQFGDAVANDPAFHAIADEVVRILTSDGAGAALIDRALDEFAGD